MAGQGMYYLDNVAAGRLGVGMWVLGGCGGVYDTCAGQWAGSPVQLL